MPKVSVIVPIFNTEKYLERCVNSLFAQTLCDVEYIFIDDGSTDDSLQLLHKLTDGSGHNCKIIENKHNAGTAFARKQGYLKATGDYFIICDSDDWMDDNELEELYTTAIKHDADIVYCNYYENKDGADRTIMQNYGTDRNQCISSMLLGKMHVSSCNKLTRLSLLRESNFFDLGIKDVGEDLVTSIHCFLLSKKVYFLDRAFYHYFVRSNSITKNSSLTNRARGTEAIIENIRIVDFILRSHNMSDVFKRELDELKCNAKDSLFNLSMSSLKQMRTTFPESNKMIPTLLYRQAKHLIYSLLH